MGCSRFQGNRALQGGGLFLQAVQEAHVYNSSFSHQQVSEWGGAVYSASFC